MDFDDVAREWDNEKRIERAKIIANKIKTTITVGKDKSAMEFGCGTGLVSFNLHTEFKNITLIDTSKEMINVVNNKIEALNLSNINTYCEDLVQNKLNEKFDIIYSSMALHHIVDIDRLCKEFYNMLNLNGTLCIVDLNKDDGSFHKNEIGFNGHNGFSKTWLKSILEVNGFSNITFQTFYEGAKQIDNNELRYSLFIMTADKI
ncbi:S-adenosylmethionine-dependent methyltransferase [Clostridium gelidum]|uniref:S-adenosylmethionine-dependent methyltransferase n=1 Tax=Clostridium gelidum TaxID=704125 RepID=A0ABM7T9D1_9CLOT|nr:class I SAM-dependent methyltransferase [Clostridium gelidum]BCZ47730.1 S-adenosylmethionine-dependent methyltransferase [Clostridium gelidum]